MTRSVYSVLRRRAIAGRVCVRGHVYLGRGGYRRKRSGPASLGAALALPSVKSGMGVVLETAAHAEVELAAATDFGKAGTFLLVNDESCHHVTASISLGGGA